MQTFKTLSSAIGFISSLNIPPKEIAETLHHAPYDYNVRLKHADCDNIRVVKEFDENFKPFYKVEKTWFGGPIALSELLGMLPKRYEVPNF